MHNCEDCVKDSILVEAFSGDPMIRIVDFLIDNMPYDYSKDDIAEGAMLSRATVFSYFNKLEHIGAVKVSRTIGKRKMYRLDTNNFFTKKMMELDRYLVDKATKDVFAEFEKEAIFA